MTRLTFIAVVSLFCLSKASAAQSGRTPPFFQPVGIHSTSAMDVHPEEIKTVVKLRDDEKSNPGVYFLTGAAIGAVAIGVAAGIELSKCADDCMLAGPMTAIVVSAGAVVGGVSGLVVYLWRRAT